MVYKVAITGGIGSGKSSLGNFFRTLGYPVIDADRLASSVLSSEKTVTLLKEHFGEKILSSDGTIHRKTLREIIVNHPQEKIFLENHMHPQIEQMFNEVCKKLAEISSKSWVFYEIPLLFETKSERKFETIIVVTVDEEIRIQRLMSTRGLGRSEVEKILAVQMPDSEKIPKADYIINNSFDMQIFEERGWDCLKFLRQKLSQSIN